MDGRAPGADHGGGEAEAQYAGWLKRLLTHPVRGLENWKVLLDTLTGASGAIKVYCVVSDM